MDSSTKPNLANLSKLASSLARARISPAIKIQRVLALASSDIAREAVAKSFQRLQLTSDEVVFAGMTVLHPTTPQIINTVALEILSNQIDIIVSETGALPEAAQAILEDHLIRTLGNPCFMLVAAFPLNSQEETKLAQAIHQRRSAHQLQFRSLKIDR